MAAREFKLWLIVKRAEDVPDQWVAHALDIDVVTQGDSMQHAIQMGLDAVLMTLLDDVDEGRDPLRHRAPQEYWDELWSILSGDDVRRNLHGLNEADIQAVAVQANVRITPSAHQREPWDVPAIWARPKRDSGAAAYSV